MAQHIIAANTAPLIDQTAVAVRDQHGANIVSQLQTIMALGFPSQDVKADVQAALDAARNTRNARNGAEVAAALQEVRKHVFSARSCHAVTDANHIGKPGFEALAVALLDVHRAINALIGGKAPEDCAGEPPSALAALMDKLEMHINIAEDIREGYCMESLGSLYAFNYSTGDGASGSLMLDAKIAVDRGDDAQALALLPQVRQTLCAELAKINDTDGRWLHLTACLQAIELFLAAAAADAGGA